MTETDIAPQFHIQEPVMMCHTDDANFWAHGWQNKTKFKGRVLAEADLYDFGLEPKDIFTGKVVHGWVLAVAGDTSGCGWDTTIYFEDEEPDISTDDEGNKTWDGASLYDPEFCYTHQASYETHKDTGSCTDAEHDAEVVDGPHKATWWEPA